MIHTISHRERLLKASDNGSRTAKHPSSNSPNGELDGVLGPTRRTGELDRASRLSRPFGKFDPSNSPNRRVRPNMQSNSPVRRVGSISLPSPRPHSSPPLWDQIELALVSSRSESPFELYDLKTV